MARAHEALDKVCNKIRENILSNENRDGLLTGKQEDYFQCLEMKYRDLEILLRQDEAKWAENLQNKKREANKVNNELEVFLAEQKTKLEALMNRSMSMFN